MKSAERFSEWPSIDLSEVVETLLDVSSRLEIQQVLNAIVKQAVRLLDVQGSALAVCEPETGLARVVALHNIPFEYEELILSPGASAASHVLITGEPVVINDLDIWENDHPALRRGTGSRKRPYNAILAVPLTWENKIMGSLTVVDPGEQRRFDQTDVRMLNMLAKLASVALNNAQLYSQVIQLNQQLEKKIEERTHELGLAQDELARKAEQLQLLFDVTITRQEEERARIARDLHDGSNQLITGTMYEIQAALQSIHSNRLDIAVEKLETSKDLLRQINDENRRLISDLRPPILDAYSFVTALKRLTERYQGYQSTKYSLDILGQPIRLSERMETALYRILQEALNNIAIHSYAHSAVIKLHFQEKKFQMTVEDDGVGFDKHVVASKNRVGIIGMRERVQSLDGRLEIWSEPGKGTRLVLEVPLNGSNEGKEIKSIPSSSLDALNLIAPTGARTVDRSHEQIRQEYSRWITASTRPEQKAKQTKFKRNAKESSDFQSIALAIEELQEENAISLTKSALERGMSPQDILHNGVMAGLKSIGEKFESRYYFLSELLTGAKLAEECIEILDPYLSKGDLQTRGIVVIGAVQGDIHSIGYGLVARQLELAGYEVHSLGINVPPIAFIRKAEEVNADIIALSAFLVTTVPYCTEVIKYLRDMGLRDRYKVIIGGSETNQRGADAMGADGWARDAIEAAKLCDMLLGHSDTL